MRTGFKINSYSKVINTVVLELPDLSVSFVRAAWLHIIKDTRAAKSGLLTSMTFTGEMMQSFIVQFKSTELV